MRICSSLITDLESIQRRSDAMLRSGVGTLIPLAASAPTHIPRLLASVSLLASDLYGSEE